MSFTTERAALIKRLLPNVASAARLAKERKIVTDLFAKYPDMKFWAWLTVPFELETLAYFFGPKGSAYLRQAYGAFTFEPPCRPAPFVLGKKLGEDVHISVKPRTLKEFLNG